ncbi:rhomboid-like protein [Kitasatospora sp. NPDC090091]|uniref:rhomboid-like protein n=1 Tax=Kitasatospora sp. NPDC090091 TaxID=3364081 RepID=UPI0037FFA7CB
MAGLRIGAERNGPRREPGAGTGSGPPYGMLRFGLRSALLGWLLARVPTPRRNPFALGYVAVVGATSTFAMLADPDLVLRLQEASSSDGDNLLHHPLRALLLSGFWVAGTVWMPYLWAFAFTVAPLERRIGAGRAAAVFATGHIAATVLSQGVVIVAVLAGRLDPAELDRLDIGVSYGVLASIAALAGLLRPRGRLLALGGAALLLADQYATDQDLVTGIGHPAALLAGVALWRWLRRVPDRRAHHPRGVAQASAPAVAPAASAAPSAAGGAAVLDRM